jgi:hypothetical protein
MSPGAAARWNISHGHERYQQSDDGVTGFHVTQRLSVWRVARAAGAGWLVGVHADGPTYGRAGRKGRRGRGREREPHSECPIVGMHPTLPHHATAHLHDASLHHSQRCPLPAHSRPVFFEIDHISVGVHHATADMNRVAGIGHEPSVGREHETHTVL